MKKFFVFLLLCVGISLHAESINVLAAANLSKALEEVKQAYLKEHPQDSINITFISSGKAYAQIKNQAPIDLFVSADTSYPQKLHDDGLSTEPIVYAQGVLVLWSKDQKIENLNSLLDDAIANIALPNPDLAPYGRAGLEALEQAKLVAKLTPKLRQATSVAQAHQWVESKNSQAGFGALSLIDPEDKQASVWIVDSSLYSPIKQALTLTNQGKDKKLARDFAQFILNSQEILKKYGYLAP